MDLSSVDIFLESMGLLLVLLPFFSFPRLESRINIFFYLSLFKGVSDFA